MITIDPKIKCKKVTGKAFRLVYDRKNFITIIDGTDKSKTWTKHNVEEFIVNQEAFDRINELGLEYTPPEILQIKGTYHERQA